MALLLKTSTSVEPFSILKFDGAVIYNIPQSLHDFLTNTRLTFVVRYISQGAVTAITNRVVTKYSYIESMTRTVRVAKLKVIIKYS